MSDFTPELSINKYLTCYLAFRLISKPKTFNRVYNSYHHVHNQHDKDRYCKHAHHRRHSIHERYKPFLPMRKMHTLEHEAEH